MSNPLHTKQHSTDLVDGHIWHTRITKEARCHDPALQTHEMQSSPGDKKDAERGVKCANSFNKFSFKAMFEATGPGWLQEWEGPWLQAQGAALTAIWLSAASPSKHSHTTPSSEHPLNHRFCGGHPAPHVVQGNPHSSVSVYNSFFAWLQSPQEANLARAERQFKSRHLSSVPGSVTGFLCNCWICLCLSFHLYNRSCRQFCLFKGSRWLCGEALVELELWDILLIQIYENGFRAILFFSFM